MFTQRLLIHIRTVTFKTYTVRLHVYTHMDVIL